MDDALKAARQQIIDNNTTALTTSKDFYYAYHGSPKFDEIHEFIHILTAPGGESSLHKFCRPLNEGTVNVMTELLMVERGEPISTRYPTETCIAKRFINSLSNTSTALPLAFRAAFHSEAGSSNTNQTEIWNFFKEAGTMFMKNTSMPKSFSEKSWSYEQAGTEFMKKTQEWNLKWLSTRLPSILSNCDLLCKCN